MAIGVSFFRYTWKIAGLALVGFLGLHRSMHMIGIYFGSSSSDQMVSLGESGDLDDVFHTWCYLLISLMFPEALEAYWQSVKDTKWFREHPILSSPDT
jgi:hypothetical protein